MIACCLSSVCLLIVCLLFAVCILFRGSFALARLLLLFVVIGILLFARSFVCSEALKPGALISKIKGGKDDDNPLYVHFPDPAEEPDEKRRRTDGSQECVRDVIQNTAYTVEALVGLPKMLNLTISEHGEPGRDTPFVGRSREGAALKGKIKWPAADAKLAKVDKQNSPIFDYATISGAGKSRWGFHVPQFLADEHKDVKRCGINFNGGTGEGPSDRNFVTWARGENIQCPWMKIMAGLLLARGLLKCSPEVIMHNPAWIFDLPPKIVIDALFSNDAWSSQEGVIKVLVVHVDELALLLGHGCGPRDLKDLVNPLAEYNTGDDLKGWVVPIITHTSPLKWAPLPTEIPVEDCFLEPLNFQESILVAGHSDIDWEKDLAARRSINACGGHPALLVGLRDLLEAKGYHLGQLFESTTVIRHKAGLRYDDRCHEVLLSILKQEIVEIDRWSSMLQKGLLWMSPSGRDRTHCKLSCPYPMLVNMLIKVNDRFAFLVPPVFPESDYSFESFEVITALRIAADCGNLQAFRGRATRDVLKELEDIKTIGEPGVFLARHKNQDGIEGAGLSANCEVLECFQCKHADSGKSHQEAEEVNAFHRWILRCAVPWAKKLGCPKVLATFVTDRKPRDYRCDDIGEQSHDGVKVTFRFFTKEANKAAEGKLQAKALDSWLPLGVICV
jgi:hypothetical protein